jgi:hypothetical protein
MNKELTHINSQLKTIERKAQSLHDQISNLNAQERKLLLRKAEILHGVTIGAVVVYRGVEHRVTAIDVEMGNERPWVSGNPRKKMARSGRRCATFTVGGK